MKKLDFKSAIEELLKEKKWNKSDYSRKLNKSNSTIYTMLLRNNVSLETLIEMADAFDYDVVLTPRAGTATDKKNLSIILAKADDSK